MLAAVPSSSSRAVPDEAPSVTAFVTRIARCTCSSFRMPLVVCVNDRPVSVPEAAAL